MLQRLYGGNSDSRAQFQLKLQTGAELGNINFKPISKAMLLFLMRQWRIILKLLKNIYHLN